MGLDWIHLAQDADQWRALVNTVMDVLGAEGSGLWAQNLKRPWSNFEFCPSTFLHDMSKSAENGGTKVCLWICRSDIALVGIENGGSNNSNILCFPQRLQTDAGIGHDLFLVATQFPVHCSLMISSSGMIAGLMIGI
jgi:hypothetical protein